MPDVSTNTGSKTIDSLLTMFDDGRLLLPEIQRDFVWKRPSVESLVDSLYNGLPIGFLLVWKPGTAVAAKPVHGSRRRRAPQAQERYGYLLDGQQRLTALLLVRERDDAYPLLYYAWPDAEREGDKRFYWRARNEAPSPWSIPVADALHDGFDVVTRLAELRGDPAWKPEHEGPVLAGLTALKAIRNYPVGVLEFETDDYRKATELFVRFNSTGRKLRRGDLAMARLAIDLPDLASSRIRPAADKWKAMGFTAPFLVQCLLAVHTARFQMREPGKLWAGEDGKQVRESWTKTERAVNRLVGFLTGTVKWGAGREVPSLTALVPLVFLLADERLWSREELLVARRWLLLASLRGYFSGASQTALDQVLKALSGERTPARLWSYTKKDLPKLSDDDFLTGRIGGPTMSLYLSMLREAKARDWGAGLEYLDGTVAGHGSALQVHHFFPRALLKKHKVKASDIDTFANYVVIRQDTNLRAGADEPASYIEVALAAAGKDSRKVRGDPQTGRAGRAGALARGQLRGLPCRAPEAARRGGEPLPRPLRPRNPSLFRAGPLASRRSAIDPFADRLVRAAETVRVVRCGHLLQLSVTKAPTSKSPRRKCVP
jgi:Protein of unknown function DUF262